MSEGRKFGSVEHRQFPSARTCYRRCVPAFMMRSHRPPIYRSFRRPIYAKRYSHPHRGTRPPLFSPIWIRTLPLGVGLTSLCVFKPGETTRVCHMLEYASAVKFVDRRLVFATALERRRRVVQSQAFLPHSTSNRMVILYVPERPSTSFTQRPDTTVPTKAPKIEPQALIRFCRPTPLIATTKRLSGYC